MIHDKSLSSKILDLVVHATMLIVLGMTLLPVVHIFAISFSSAEAITTRQVGLFPVDFSIDAYMTIFKDKVIPNSFVNAIIITLLGTCFNMMMTILTAYAISKSDLPFRRIFMIIFVVSMFFGGGLIPNFLLINSLGMYNSYWALIIPTGINTFYLIIMMSFFRQFPKELEESARLDGCNDTQILVRIVLPLSKAAIATISLFYIVAHWNSWFPAMVYLKDPDKFPLQLILRQIVVEGQMAEQMMREGRTEFAADFEDFRVTPESIRYSTLVVAMVPMMIIYPFIQKYFVKGVMIGSLKG